VPWAKIESELASSWEQGQHITIAAPTGHGKTHLALALAELSRFVLVLAVKDRDDLVQSLERDGYRIVPDTSEILWAENEPLTRKVVVWPRTSEKMSDQQRIVFLAHQVRETMRWARRTGGWTVVADETMYFDEQLGLRKTLNEMWYQGRSMKVSFVTLMQRPSLVPRLAFSQASYLFIGKFPDKRDEETLRDLATTVPRELMEAGLRSLSKPKHEFLYVDCVHDRVAVTVAPPR
jgi:hypothetical protein